MTHSGLACTAARLLCAALNSLLLSKFLLWRPANCVETGQLPSWFLIEIRRPWNSSSQSLSTIPAFPLVSLTAVAGATESLLQTQSGAVDIVARLASDALGFSAESATVPLPDHHPLKPANGPDWEWLTDTDNVSAAPTPAALVACPNNLEPNNFISNFPNQMTFLYKPGFPR